MEFIFYSLLYALLLYGIGYFTLKIIRVEIKDPYTRLFASNVTGMILWVWILSCIRTSGMTVMNAMWIPALGILFYLYKNKLCFQGQVKIRFHLHVSHIIWIVCIIGISIQNYVFYLGYSVSNPSMGNVDTIYYVRLSDFIYHSGIESTNIDYLQIKPNNPNPYHYFTPWLQAGFNAIFHVESNYLVRKAVIFTIYFANIYIGLIATLKTFIKNAKLLWYHYVVPVFFFFIKPIGLGSLTAKIFGSYVLYWMNSLIQHPKYSPVVTVLIACVLLIQYRHYALFMMVLLLSPVFYVTTAPVTYCLTGCMIVWAWRKKIKELYYLPLVIAVLLAGYFMLFYGIQSKQNYIVNPSGNQGKFWERFLDFKFLSVFMQDGFQMFFVWVLSSSLFILLSLFFFRHIKQGVFSNQNIRFLALFILISFPLSFLAWQFFYYISDSEQFMASFIAPVYMLFVFLWGNLLIELLIEKGKKWVILLIAAYTFVLIYSAVHASWSEIKNYKEEYSREYVQHIQKNKHRFSEYGAMLIDDKYIWYLYFHGFPKPYIQNKNPRDFLAINICELQPIKESYDLDKLYIPLFPFYQYVEKQKSENKFVNLSQSKLEFVKKYKINHLVANKGAIIDSIFLPYIREKYVDSYSGEQLYFLDIPQK